jgi:hypothetical protein
MGYNVFHALMVLMIQLETVNVVPSKVIIYFSLIIINLILVKLLLIQV